MSRLIPPPPAWPQVGPDDEGLISWATANGITKPTVGAGLARQASLDFTNAVVTSVLGAGVPLRSRLTSDSAGCSDTTPIDTGLTFTVVADTTYELEGHLMWMSPAADDISFSWVIPSGTAGFWTLFAPPPTAASDGVIRSTGGTFASTTTAAGADATRMAGSPRGLVRVGGTGGTFKLQFAKLADSAGTDSNMETDSWLRLTPVA